MIYPFPSRQLYTFILGVFLFSINVTAQQSISGQLEWEKPIRGESGLYFPKLKNGSYDVETGSLQKVCSQIKVQGASEFKGRFTSINTVSASPQEIAGIKKSISLKEKPEINIIQGESKGETFLGVCFYPYLNRNGKIEKITSYTIEVVEQPVQRQPSYKSSAQVSNSVLSSGGWYKISVSKTGVYKITPSFLVNNNIGGSSVGINDIRIVGNGTAMLPEKNSVPRPDDLLDVPLKVFDKNGDGFFNGSDYAVFYAHGPHEWSYNESSDEFNHSINIYRDVNYYFISTVNGNGVAVPTMSKVTASATVQSQSFDDYDFRESEIFNLIGTGREWYGEVFDTELNQGYGFSFPNMDQTTPLKVRVRAGARVSSDRNTFLSATINGKQWVKLDFPQYGTDDYDPYIRVVDQKASELFVGNPSSFTLQLFYNNSMNPTGVAWLDFIEVQCRRNLVYSGVPLQFRDTRLTGTGNIAEYTISSAPSDLILWKVTDHNGVIEVPVDRSGTTITFRDNATELQEYVLFGSTNLSEPSFVAEVPPQNLHAMEDVEMVIVSHSKFMSAAKELAKFHTENDNLNTVAVNISEVYNEFSSGGQDIAAIRDFARLLYKKGQGGNKTLKYMLLMGDASYDYKDRIANNSNYIPIWESDASLNLHVSMITDDFYALLDDNEGGDGTSLSMSGQLLDIGVGRIPCQTSSQAQAAVNKIKHYTTSSNRFGDWRNKILLMADDRDDPTWDEGAFVKRSETFESIIYSFNTAFNVDKIYLDSYRQVSTTGGESYPEAHDEMYRKVQQGNLVTNYIGHGGEIGLSSEKLLGLQDVNSWTNLDALSLFMTITCEFTRLDDPKRVSAGEQLALNGQGGAIALLTTTRVVYAEPAMTLNEEVFKNVFERPGNEPKTLGQIFVEAKNDLSTSDTRLKFSLIGDPAVRLAIPYYNMEIEEVNDQPVASADLDTLKALTKMNIKGRVTDFNNDLLDNYNGIASVSVYDKPSSRKTLVNDGIGSPIPFKVRNSLIYKGKVEVVEGKFSFEFIVPKDISFEYGLGKISLYSTDKKNDAGGAYDQIYVGGFNNNPQTDNEGPLVELYINDETFVRGGVTDENPELYAVISDSSGVNTVGNKIGHNLKAVLDNNESQAYIVNEYYEADLNSYQSGKVRYPFYDIEEGSHTLSLEVFDVHNNVSKAETEFIVANSDEMALKRVLNYPNPFTTHTEFQFEHNRADHPLEVQVQIFTVSGKLVKTINRLVVSSGNRVSDQISWNGLDDYGDKIGKGVYVYRVKVRSQLDNSTADKYEKLVILR